MVTCGLRSSVAFAIVRSIIKIVKFLMRCEGTLAKNILQTVSIMYVEGTFRFETDLAKDSVLKIGRSYTGLEFISKL